MREIQRVARRLIGACLAVALLAACDSGHSDGALAESELGEPHPLPEQIYRPIPITTHFTLALEPDRQHPLYEQLHTARPVAHIGVLEGEPEYELGKIADAEVDSDGRVYVLDGSLLTAQIYNAEGRFIARFAQKGQGPGELSAPTDLLVTDGAVYIVDLSAIEVYERQVDRVTFKELLRPSIDVVAMCSTQAGLLVHGISPTSDSLIYRADSSGRYQSSFGQMFQNLSPREQIQFSQSHFGCSPDGGVVVLGPKALVGEFRAYTTQGKPKWIAVIDDFRPIEFRLNSGGGASVTFPPDGVDQISSISSSGPDWFVAQVAYTSLEDRKLKKDFTELFTFGLSAETGQVIALGSDLPRITSFTPTGFLSVTQDPFPQMTVYEY